MHPLASFSCHHLKCCVSSLPSLEELLRALDLTFVPVGGKRRGSE